MVSSNSDQDPILFRKYDISKQCGHQLVKVQVFASRDDEHQECHHCLLTEVLELQNKDKSDGKWDNLIERIKQAVGA